MATAASRPADDETRDLEPLVEPMLDEPTGDAAPRSTSSDERLAVGTSLGRYVVLGTQGEGGMGTVYEAFDRTLDRRVALKVLRRDLVSRHARRLVREAKAMAQLSHPNVVQVYEVGEVEGQTFVAMELVQGQTLSQWRRREPPPSWRACVELYLQAGAGLAAAHERGLVHRDFKPSNAIVDDKGRVRVLDFGLARTASDHSTDEAPLPWEALLLHGVGVRPEIDAQLTEHGLVMGTPAYMPLEQMRGREVGPRSDQFSFCVALYEAVYGERPFSGPSFEALEVAKREGKLAPVARDAKAPPRLREVLVRGLATDPEQRWPSMEALLEQLRQLLPPEARGLEVAAAEWERLGRPRAALWSAVQLEANADLDRRALRPRELEFLAASARAAARGRLARRVAAIAIPAALGATYGLVRLQAHAELRTRVDERIALADAGLARAQASLDALLVARWSAFEQFDAGADAPARAAWNEAKAAAHVADLELAAAARELERALTLDPSREDVRDRLGDALLERAELAELRRDEAGLAELVERLALYDADGERMARWNAPAIVSVETTPPGATVELVAYRTDADGRRLPSAPRLLGKSPLADLALPPGSYALRLALDDRPPVSYPILAERSQPLAVAVELPAGTDVPPGFVYVPAGPFLLGCRDETLCEVFYNSVPIHSVTTGSFLIARHEVTYGEWIEFLESTPVEQRAALTPRIDQSFVVVSLAPVEGGGWELVFPREGGDARARMGEPLVFAARDRRASQDWLRLPVLAITFELARAYLDWLDRSGRVPGARLCTDREWERAGRGADGRLYPHGDHLGLDDANIDLTYGKRSETAGPDVVGSHPASRSPFGVDDLSGNAGEWTVDPLHGDAPVLRGGAFFMDPISAHLVGRQVVPPGFTDGTVGMRVCASFPLPRPVGVPRPADGPS